MNLNDSFIIHNIGEMEKLIDEIGFIPLFANSVKGFSVEEHTYMKNWWCGNETIDPWEWRRVLSKNPEIGYGKFFDRKAGFISKKWFPVFANYRRNGYDFDSLFDDGLASFRKKKIMDLFFSDDEQNGQNVISYELKEKSGFSAGGEKNFEGVLSELQMQTYLLMCDFRRKTNRNGEPYGWHIAVFETPETKWGHNHVASMYKESADESYGKILRQMRSLCPYCSDKAIAKVIGIKNCR